MVISSRNIYKIFLVFFLFIFWYLFVLLCPYSFNVHSTGTIGKDFILSQFYSDIPYLYSKLHAINGYNTIEYPMGIYIVIIIVNAITNVIINLFNIIGINISAAFLFYLLLQLLSCISILYSCKLLLKILNIQIKEFVLRFWFLLPLVAMLSTINVDMIAVITSLYAIYYFKNNKFVIGSLWVVVGTDIKIYPILLGLAAILVYKNYKYIISIVVFGGVVVTNLIFYLINKQEFLYFFNFNKNRKIDLNSIFYPIVSIPKRTNFIVNIANYIEHHVTLFTFIPIILLISFTAILFYLKTYIFNKNKLDNEFYVFINLSIIFLTIFIIFNKVISPQYLLWILPLYMIRFYKNNNYLVATYNTLGIVFRILVFMYLVILTNINFVSFSYIYYMYYLFIYVIILFMVYIIYKIKLYNVSI